MLWILFTRDIVLESESVAMPSLTNVRRKQKLTDPLMLDPSTLAPVKQYVINISQVGGGGGAGGGGGGGETYINFRQSFAFIYGSY